MDRMITATSANAQIRAFAVTTTELVEKARQCHNTSPVMTAALGRLLSAGTMMGIMMKGEKDLLTLQILGDGPAGGVTVTADSSGRVKGYAHEPNVIIPAKPNGKLDVSGAIGPGGLRVIRDMGLKEPYIGEIPLVSGEIAEDLTYYFAVSEQIPSSVGLGVLMNRDNTVFHAGGFIVQLMPFATDEVIEQLESNIAKLPSVTAMLTEDDRPETLLEHVLEGFDIEYTGEYKPLFHCDCSRERISRVLLTLGESQLKELIDENEPTEICCHFCNSKYTFSVEDLENLLAEGRGEEK